MSWKYDEIKERTRKSVTERYKNTDRNDLLKRIIELETTLYPFNITLSSILDDMTGPRESTWFSSKLFPFREDGFKFYVYNTETKKTDAIDLREEELAETEYYLEDSIILRDGTKLGDEFEVLGVHQSAIAAYCFCGSITVEDIKRLREVMKNEDA